MRLPSSKVLRADDAAHGLHRNLSCPEVPLSIGTVRLREPTRRSP
jgi:hypothetical protein